MDEKKEKKKSEWTILLRSGVPTPQRKSFLVDFLLPSPPISTPHATFLLAAFAVNGKHLAEDGNYKISALCSLVSREKKGQAQVGMIIARSKRDPVAEFGILLEEPDVQGRGRLVW